MDTVPNDPLNATADELFEHAPCGYLTALADGTIARANRTLLDLAGLDAASLPAGLRFRDLLTVPGQVFHDTHYAPLLRMQGAVKEVALDLRRPGRDPLPVLVNAVQRPDADGRPVLTWVTVFDATDRRTYERELRAARLRAEQATETERAARGQAEAAGRAKDEFLALVSHELRSPLNAILGWTQLLRRGREHDADLQDGLAVVERNTRVQVQLIEDLLDMGRITSGKMRLDVQTVDLSAAVEAALDTARPAADARGIRLQKVLDPTVVVSGDPGRLQQIFWNLLNNAVKFTPKGGFVRVVMGRVNSHIEVSVTDSGQGMKPEFIPHAFERFRQADTAGTQRTGGLGLGLSIVRQLVEMHGGSVRAASDGEGKGSTFVVDLPLIATHGDGGDGRGGDRVHPRPAITDAPVDLGGITLAGVRVLVVDDEPDAREVVRRVLADAHAEVLTAGSADEGVAAVERFCPHVLVSDVGMPGEDGYQFIRRVRMLGDGLGNTKAVALTAFGRLEDRTKAMLAGFQMHVGKPVEPSELVVTVASLAGRVRA